MFNDSTSEDAVVESVLNFKAAGGGCIVENSTLGLDRRTSFLKELSQKTGVHIIAGTGYYLESFLNQLDIKTGTTEEMATHMIDELMDGCADDKSFTCGFIGEIAIDDPMTSKLTNCMNRGI